MDSRNVADIQQLGTLRSIGDYVIRGDKVAFLINEKARSQDSDLGLALSLTLKKDRKDRPANLGDCVLIHDVFPKFAYAE